ncbi:hypothetical protein V6N11_070727 [Hibiscus sabdariffa]|uniref:Subtilisin-like protease fibronectin type-III domain-containing protein n=1 Tax=Hibiscus sabdariffa TaxID=183260 RepID=A0ABR2QFV9_9ROSI
MYPFIAGAAAPNTSHGYTSEDSRYCDPGTLDKTLVEGKILFCDYYSQADGPIDAGAVAAVFQTDKHKDYVFPYGLPLSNLNLNDGRNVLSYANTAENPTATIFKTQVDGNQFAPFVVSFSSRGPSSITADILKVVVNAPPGLIIQVQPSVLSFKSLGQKQSFTVTVGAEVGNSMISGALVWDDGVHQVRSPIVAYASLLE